MYAAVLYLQACSNQTGILIQVTRDADSNIGPVDELRFFVAAPDETGALVSVQDDVELITLEEARDLAADPYSLLLRKGQLANDEIWVLVVARNSKADRIATGQLTNRISFHEGKIHQWTISVRDRPCESGVASPQWYASTVALYTFDVADGQLKYTRCCRWSRWYVYRWDTEHCQWRYRLRQSVAVFWRRAAPASYIG